jgi:hypothetical protein
VTFFFRREIKELKFENTIFESILERKKAEPVVHHVLSMSASQTSSTPNDINQDVTNTNTTSRADRLVRKRSRSRSTQSDIRVQLTLEQKLDFITSEYEQTKTEKLRYEIAHEKDTNRFEVCFHRLFSRKRPNILVFFCFLQSDREWIDNEITDSELSIVDLCKLRDSSIDTRTKKIIGEKLVRYFNDRLKGRESFINKLHDRSSGIKGQIQRLDRQLRQNEEMGDGLNEIDFNQLKIENKQFLDKIDEKNLELVLLKQQVAKFTHLFNHYKNILQMRTQDLMDIQKRIDKQQNLLEYTEREMVAANYEQTRAAKKHSDLVEQTEGFHVPEILDYVRKKALLYKLQRDCEIWQRKLEILSVDIFYQWV